MGVGEYIDLTVVPMKKKNIIDFVGMDFYKEKSPSMRLKARRMSQTRIRTNTARNVKGVFANLFSL
jgi:hypothetical protein